MALERELAEPYDQRAYQRMLADLRRRRQVWLDRASACRRAWESLLAASALHAGLAPDDPVRTVLDQAAALLEDLLADLETTANIASEEIAAWQRQHQFEGNGGRRSRQ